MSSLLDSIVQSFSPDLTRSLASTLGESSGSAQKGLQTSSAVILGTLASRVQETGFMNQVMNLITGAGASAMTAAAAAGGAASAAATETGSNFLHLLFGGNRSAVETKVAQSSGLQPSSAGTIFSTAAPIVLGVLASRISAGVGGVASLTGLLTAEIPHLRSIVPSGLPGMSALSGGATGVVSPVTTEVSDAPRSGDKWLWPVLLLGALLIGGLVWYFNRGATVTATTATAVTDTATASVSAAAKSAWASLGEFSKRKLQNGVELNFPRLGVENKLIDFIESSKPADDTTWFDFDRLLFATDSATLEAASQEQLSNVAAILKAYPNVHVRIGGYTDNTGNAAANLTLSEARANSVLAELTKLGVDGSRMDAKGYGEEHPVAGNATEDGRAKNRRISLRVTQK